MTLVDRQYIYQDLTYVQPIIFRSIDSYFNHESQDFDIQLIRGVQRWEWDISFQGNSDSEIYHKVMSIFFYPKIFDSAFSFNANLEDEVLHIAVPQDRNVFSQNSGGNIRLTNNASVGSSSFQIESNSSFVIQRGSFITFRNTSSRSLKDKVYLVTQDAISNNSNTATLHIYPYLYHEIDSGDRINYARRNNNSNIGVFCKITNSSLAFNYLTDGQQRLTVTFREQIN